MIDTDLSRYETYLRSEERSANTIAKYLRDLRVFFTFMGNESLCKEAVVSFKGYLTESYAPASVNSMLAAVNGFLEWSGMPQMKVKPLKIQKCLFAKPEKELPSLRPLIFLTLIFRTIDSLKIYDMPFVLTQGGPGNSTEFLSLHIYRLANAQNGLIGRAAANAIILMVISTMVSKILIHYQRKGD